MKNKRLMGSRDGKVKEVRRLKGMSRSSYVMISLLELMNYHSLLLTMC